MYQKMEKVIDQIREKVQDLQDKHVTAGFDGFVDLSVHTVKSRDSQKVYSSFREIEEFASYLASKAGKSGTIEIVENCTKIGGNMPIMSLALGKMGIPTASVGAMGYPKIRREFADLDQENCRMISIGNPGQTIALEFDDGKIMLAKMDVLQKITWKTIEDLIPPGEMQKLFGDCDVLALLNWSELEYATEIWEGLLAKISEMSDGRKEMSILIWQTAREEKVRISGTCYPLCTGMGSIVRLFWG